MINIIFNNYNLFEFSFFIEKILPKYLKLNNNFELVLVSENNFDIY